MCTGADVMLFCTCFSAILNAECLHDQQQPDKVRTPTLGAALTVVLLVGPYSMGWVEVCWLGVRMKTPLMQRPCGAAWSRDLFGKSVDNIESWLWDHARS